MSASSHESAPDKASDIVGDDRIQARPGRSVAMSTPPFSPELVSVTPTNESRTSLLTQFTLNLPCDTQDRITFNRPEVSSDEFSFNDVNVSMYGDTQASDFA